MSCFLSNSSLGKKLVMSVTGCFLVLFLLFHMSMNIVAIISPEAYNMICALLGANWYALAGTLVLAAGVVIHFIYAVILTLENRKARGSQRYAVTVVEPGVKWASKNMLVLGFIILGGLALHLFNFWAKMQLVEIMGGHENSLGFGAADGASLIAYTFSQWYYVVIYLVWFFALWFHLTHGVWSMFQTVGWANDTWYPRLKCIANIVATIIFLGFAAVVVVYFIKSICPCCAGACLAEHPAKLVREAGSLVKSGAHRALDLLAPVVAPDVKAGGRTRRVTQNRLMAAGYALSLAGLAFRGAKAHLLFGALFTVLLGVHLYQHRRVL